MSDWVDELIREIEVLYGISCSICGADMKFASFGPEGTFYACSSPDAEFIGRKWGDDEYKAALEHYRNSRIRVNSDAQSAAKHIISIIKQKERIL